MELSPQSVSSTTFKIVKKGYDPDEVRAYLGQLASSIESIQAHTTAMEARARAAVARLQEIAAQTPPQSTTSDHAAPSAEEAVTISRTLLLAQRTADQTIADAEGRAKAIVEAAESDSRSAIEGAQEAAARTIEDAKVEARKAGEGQRIEVESQVQALLARREFLLGDVDHLEQHMVVQRDRLKDVAAQLTVIVERAPGGLADIRRPLISAVESDEVAGEAENRAVDATPITDEATAADAPAAADIAEGSGPFDETVPIENSVPSSITELAHEDSPLAPPEPGTAVGAAGDSAEAQSATAGEDAGEASANLAAQPSTPSTEAESLDPIWSSDDDSTPPAGIPTQQFNFDQATSEVTSAAPDATRD